MPADAPYVCGYDFNKGIDHEALLNQYMFQGFQGSNLGLAVEQINRMLSWRLSDEPIEKEKDDSYMDPEIRKNTKCTIFFSYTSNMISCGNREIIRFLCQHKLVDCIVTTGGGIEEDFMKCFAKTYMGDFTLKGSALRKKGLNRIGNLLVPNDNYSLFEDWMIPILDAMLSEQQKDGKIWTPSSIIRRMGKEINNPDSVYYWCYKNNIPVYSPAITDGSIGDMVYFHSFMKKGLIIDIAADIRGINDTALHAKKTGMVILGGGLVKHHVCNANLMRNGADFSVFVNTGQEFDGSDSGARPDEAISWGKIKIDAKPVKVYADASLVFPLLVAQTFAKQVYGGVAAVSKHVVPQAQAAALAAAAPAKLSSTAPLLAASSSPSGQTATAVSVHSSATASNPIGAAKGQKQPEWVGVPCDRCGLAVLVAMTVVLVAGAVMLAVGFATADDCYVCYGRSDHSTASTLGECEALHSNNICVDQCESSSDPYVCEGSSFSALVAFASVLMAVGSFGICCTAPVVHGRSVGTRLYFFVQDEAFRQDQELARQQGSSNNYLVYGNL